MGDANFFHALKFIDFITIYNIILVIFIPLFWISLHVLRSWRSRKLPGPMGLPILGYVPFLGKEPHKTLWDLKKRYGDIMGLYFGRQYVVVLSEYNVAKEILQHPAAQKKTNHIFQHVSHIGFRSENGEAWTEQRKFCRFVTHDVELGELFWENLFMEEVTSFVNEIRAKKGEAVDISHLLSVSVMSNMLSILIGRRLKKEKEAAQLRVIREYSDVVLTATGVSKAVTVIPGLRKFCEFFGIGDHHEILGKIQRYTNFIREEIRHHKTSRNNSDDFINVYLSKLAELENSGNKKHFFSEKMLEGNINILFLGGTHTLVSLLSWILRLMAKHKYVQDKVYMELMEVIGFEGRARYRERQNIPYTFAVLMEAQRISSIVPFSPNRRVTRDINVGGFVIPKDSHVTANLWGLHHDPTYWEKPEEFKPERFLTENGTQLIMQPSSYFPFSTGTRICPGDVIAWMEVLFYFAEIVKNFEIFPIPGTELKFDIIYGHVTCLVDQPLCFKERKRNT